MVVAHRDDLRNPGFYLKGGFDPEIPFRNEDEAIAALRTRKGKSGAVKTLVCPYTGKPLKIMHRNGPGYWQITGEFFSPRALVQIEENLLYYMSMRGGKKPKFEPREKIEIIAIDRVEVSDPTDGLKGNGSEVEEGLSLLLGD
jgi:hypothetical protein